MYIHKVNTVIYNKDNDNDNSYLQTYLSKPVMLKTCCHCAKYVEASYFNLQECIF